MYFATLLTMFITMITIIQSAVFPFRVHFKCPQEQVKHTDIV